MSTAPRSPFKTVSSHDLETIKVSGRFARCQISKIYGAVHSFFAGLSGRLLYSWAEECAMSLAERIQKDIVSAMRAKDELRLSVLRGIKTAMKNKEVEKIRALDEAESIQILQMLVKQRKESIEQFTKGNRPELAAKETRELAILETYLPAGPSEAEMDAAIAKAIAETGANSIKQMGAVVKAAKAALEGKTVDGKALSDRVRDRLPKS